MGKCILIEYSIIHKIPLLINEIQVLPIEYDAMLQIQLNDLSEKFER